MSVDYDCIAERYDAHRRAQAPYIETLLGLLKACPGRRILELGSGTGNSTSAIAAGVPCDITALEISRGMLQQARKKDIPARWVRGSAMQLPFKNASFNFIFGIYMLHYIPDLDVLFRECARVLERGSMAFVTAPHAFIQNHPMNDYFPSFAKVDLARFQPVEIVETVLRNVGCQRVDHARKSRVPEPVDEAYVDKVEGKFLSTFDLLPQEEFSEGLARLRKDVAEHRRPGLTVTWETVTIWGWLE
jgi:ubiquinone/menaquinone biosynthesis C-methylase UbiE